MVGIVLVAHEPLASALAASCAHVYACAPDMANAQLAVLDVAPDAAVQPMLKRLRELVGRVDSGHGVLILTDVIGATPCNLASKLIGDDHVAVVAGVNLPMLLRALCYRQDGLEEVMGKVLNGGVQGIVRVNDQFMQR